MSEKRDDKIESVRSIPIVAVGASAGGLDAFQKFLTKLPADSGMAFVLIQHLDPNHETMMPELLQKSTSMGIEQVKDKLEIQSNHIYFIAPNSTLTIQGNTLISRKPKEAHGHRSPIDLFFKSLAEAKSSNAIGVILSGTGSDGSIGIKAIKEAGGLTFAQSLESAKYDSMPRNAVGTGMVDFVMEVEEMSEHIVQYIQHSANHQFEGINPSPEAKKILSDICRFLLKNLNHDFTNYKENTLLRRIHRRMQMRQIEKGEKYLQYLYENPKEAKALLNDFLIVVTYFFRDAEVFDFMKEEIIPKIIKNNKDLVRVWVPGCATGEEAYSIAMLMKEVSEDLGVNPKIQIFGTDLDDKSVAAARKAVYTEGIVEHVSPYRIKKFFHKVGNNYEVTKSIRDMCLFSKHDLLRDPPFARIDLVSCRNLLIYFGTKLQASVMSLFRYSAKSDGYLLLGPTESLRGDANQFQVISKEHKVFKSMSSYIAPRGNFPLKLSHSLIPDLEPAVGTSPQNSTARSGGFSNQVDSLMLKQHIPPHLVVNKHFDVQFFSHNLDGFIVPAKGIPSNNIIQIIVPQLRAELRTLLTKAVSEADKVSRENIRFKSEAGLSSLEISIEPLKDKGSDGESEETLYLILFKKTKPSKKVFDLDELSSTDDLIPEEMEHLHDELKSVRLQLQTTIEELEHANEELKSSNEELLSLNEEMQSGNEELQTSHEEMQSVNEELETVNVELSTKVAQLDAANSDLENLFRSTEIATIFLDNSFKIKRYTPRAKAIFNFIQSDLHRPITDLAFSFDDFDIEEELSKVINQLITKTDVVRLSKTNTWFKIQMHPYKTVNNVIEGAIITLHDITELKHAEGELSYRLDQQTSVADFGFKALSNEMELPKLRKHAIRTLKETLEADFVKILELLPDGKELLLLEGTGWNSGLVGKAKITADLGAQAGFTLNSKHPVVVSNLDDEQRFSGPDLLIDHGVKSGVSVVIKGSSGRAYGVLGIHSKKADFFTEKDIQYVQSIANTLATAIERNHLIQSKTRLARIVESSKEIIFSCDIDRKIDSWNPAAENTYGIKLNRVLGRKVSNYIVRNEDVEALDYKIKKVIEGESFDEIDTEFFNSEGDRITVSLNLTPIKASNNKVVGISFVGRDITEHLSYEQLLIDAKNAANEANELKSRFMGVLSHELRTPLSAILGYADLLVKNNNLSDSERTDFLQKVMKNGDLLKSLVSDILDVSKIEEGKVDIKRTWFKLNDYVSELISALGILAHKKDLELDVKYIGRIPDKINTDPLRLRQILENLVSNAIKYTDKGRVEIRIRVKVEDNSHALYIEVEDTGRGIAEDKAKNLFSPFFRAEPGKGAPGVGLGLYLAKNLAYQLGGRLSLFKSEVEKGSIFKLYIPVEIFEEDSEKTATDSEHATIVTDTSLKDRKILIAEDSDDLRGLLVAYLELAGAEVDAYENGVLAYNSLKKKKYDIAVLDLYMPEMDGRELVGKIKEKSIEMPTVVLTAHAMSNVRQECLDLGFDDYISKPVSQEKLVKAIIKNLN